MFRIAVYLLSVSSCRAINWREMACPKGSFAAAGCETTAPSTQSDELVSLFFQFEGEAAGSFACTGADRNVTYCSRSWMLAEQGSAGTCVFLLPAGASMQCTGHGGVTTVIDAQSAPVGGIVLGTEWASSPCPRVGAMQDCTYRNDGTDTWVQSAFGVENSSASSAELSCALERAGVEVCSFAAKSAPSSSSCAFLIPSGDTLHCRQLAGQVTVTSSASVPLARPITDKTTVGKNATCPPSTLDTPSQTTLCDCNYTNEWPDRDVLVTMNALNVDGQFSSFHCYVGDVNMCAWGTNSGEPGEGGSCSFILPASETYFCQMQWGASAFRSTSLLPLNATIFAPTAAAGRGRPHSARQPDISSRSEDELRQLYTTWLVEHAKQFAADGLHNESVRFANFRKHVALVDALARPGEAWATRRSACLPRRLPRAARPRPRGSTRSPE